MAKKSSVTSEPVAEPKKSEVKKPQTLEIKPANPILGLKGPYAVYKGTNLISIEYNRDLAILKVQSLKNAASK